MSRAAACTAAVAPLPAQQLCPPSVAAEIERAASSTATAAPSSPKHVAQQASILGHMEARLALNHLSKPQSCACSLGLDRLPLSQKLPSSSLFSSRPLGCSLLAAPPRK